MGVVQLVHRGPKFILYNLDDGTGAIQCIVWIPDKYQNLHSTSTIPNFQEHQLGQLVRIIGQPGDFNGVMQVTFQPGDSDPNDETIFRLRVLNLEQSVYSKPVVLPDNVLSEIDIQGHEIKKDSQTSASESTLLEAIRAWVLRREEFFYIDLEDDDENSKLARDIIQTATPGLHPGRERMQVSELMGRCLQHLLSEGVVEFKSMDRMILRVIKTPALTVRKSPEVIELDLDEGMHEVIFLDDSE
ncbi:CST complex subunit STN1 [Haplosporangium sp. Z 27]|nr:CST complex subunit STN1 [Haplosporangium sp. Z 27]